MNNGNLYEELKSKYQAEDRAKLLMQQLRTYRQTKQQQKWWKKILSPRKTKTEPITWE